MGDDTALNMGGFTGYWTPYIDIMTSPTPYDSTILEDWAWSVGIDPEEVFVHANQDWTYTKATAWSQMDWFGRFQNGVNKGIFLETGGVYSDVTSAAYNGPYITINKNLLIGYELPFDQANFAISIPGVSVVGTWQYWNGTTWTTLTTTDGTNNFTQSGKLYFVPPGNWARHSENGSHSKYWIRFAYTSATTSPQSTKISGDTWYNDGIANHCRGWDESSGTIVNSGELAYNPTPPVGATAKFKYQSRINVWSVNHFVLNPVDFQMIGGVSTRTAAAYIAYKSIQNATSWIPYSNGVMLDDLPAVMQGITTAQTDFYTKDPVSTWDQAARARYADVHTMTKAAIPTFVVGGNTQQKVYAVIGDWALHEGFNNVLSTADGVNNLLATTDSATISGFDDYLPENMNVKGVLVFNDPSAYAWKDGTFQRTYYDRSNRGPLTALTKFLIGQNDNTYFAYFAPDEGTSYTQTDEVYYLDPAKDTSLTSPLSVAQDSTIKYIYGSDFSQFPSGYSYAKVEGSNTEVFYIHKENNTSITTTSPINFSHSTGDVIRFAETHYQSDGLTYTIDNVLNWGTHFPAMDVNFGTPSARNEAWALGTFYGWGTGKANNIWSRDYANALVLHRGNGGSTSTTDYDTYSVPLDLGGIYYPLKADGTTGAPVDNIQLRRSEGAILMKSPIGAVDTTFPAAPSGLSVL